MSSARSCCLFDELRCSSNSSGCSVIGVEELCDTSDARSTNWADAVVMVRRVWSKLFAAIEAETHVTARNHCRDRLKRYLVQADGTLECLGTCTIVHGAASRIPAFSGGGGGEQFRRNIQRNVMLAVRPVT